MSVEELEKAVAALPHDELATFSAWFEAYLTEVAGRQHEDHDAAGKQSAGSLEGWRSLARDVAAVWQGEKGAVETLAEMRR